MRFLAADLPRHAQLVAFRDDQGDENFRPIDRQGTAGLRTAGMILGVVKENLPSEVPRDEPLPIRLCSLLAEQAGLAVLNAEIVLSPLVLVQLPNVGRFRGSESPHETLEIVMLADILLIGAMGPSVAKTPIE